MTMRYPFPGQDAKGHDKTYLSELPSLARTKPGSAFVSSFYGVWALNFDDLTHDFCRDFRKVDLASCDALYPDKVSCAPRIYFIEFKNRSLNELNKQGADGKDEEIGVELSKKIVDSLSVVAATCLRDKPMQDIQKQAEFIVVYADSANAQEPESFSSLTAHLSELAHVGADRQNITVLWNLNRFKSAGFCRSVCTLSESQFKQYARSFMKRTDGSSDF